eukprot:GFUD01018762.1.p1 GENE.GFUD01018762.1~~GFUD01018762.1.p1  ORF type:complete len:485 (+),score=126.29 GFUD01018762.1:18-1472(+)
MLTNIDHAEFIHSTITNSVNTSRNDTTPDTVVQFVCEDGQVVTTNRSLVICFSPFLRSVICSTPNSSQVISLPDASSTGVQGVLNMISQKWMEEIYVLTNEEFEVLSSLEIPVGNLEKVQIFSTSDLQIQNFSSDEILAAEFEEINPNKRSSPVCPQCGMNFGEISEDTKEEIYIHMGEIHSEEELLAECYKVFPDGSNKCEVCNLEVNSDYVKKEHIMLTHPWPMLKATVDELISDSAVIGMQIDGVDLEEQYDDINNEKEEEVKVPLQQMQQTLFKIEHNNSNSKPLDTENNKAKRGKKREMKRKSEPEASESPLYFPYVPQRKSAKKASLSITKSFEGEDQHDLGRLVKTGKLEEPKFIEAELKHSETNKMTDLLEDIEELLQDSDQEDGFGEDINYETSSVDEIGSEDEIFPFDEVFPVKEIEGIQDCIEFSDSDGEEDEGELNNTIKFENKTLTNNDEVDDDIPEIQESIEFSDSEEDD